MSSFSVSGNYYLRQLYSANRDLASGNARTKVSTRDLAKADTAALKRGIASLSDYDYDAENEDSVDFYKTIKAFADTYNQTLESNGKLSENSSSKSGLKDMEKLRKDYAEQLEDLGVTFDSKGYMKLSDSAFDNISVSNFKDTFGSDSDFLSDLSRIQKKLSRHINYLV